MVDGASSHDPWRPPDPGARPTELLDGYEDLVVVGRGGESVVYRAREPRLGRDVAVKVLLVDDVESAARFAREIEITVGLGRQHPNIVTVLATGTTSSGRPAIVMEYYDGGTLNDQLRERGPFPAEEVVRIGLVLSDALAFAHAQGFLHRDVKPQNVLVLPTSWVLADFGIARLVDADYTSSVEAFTYRHASPQILDGYPPTQADDIWSLGSTLYTLLECRTPFSSDDPDDDSALAYLRRARTEPPRPFSRDPGELGAVISRCLAKDVSERWSSVQEVHDALSRLRHGAWEPRRSDAAQAPPAPAAAPREETRRRGSADAPSAGPGPVEPPTPVAAPTPAPAMSAASDDPAHEHTHLRPGRDGASGASDGDPARAPRRRGRAVVLLGAAALVAGAALGLAGALLREDPPAEPTQVAPEDLVEAGGAQPDVPDPALDFRMVDLRQRAGEVTVEWTDPSDGAASFHIVQTSPRQGPVQGFPRGATTATFTLSQPPGYTCFVMVAVMPDGAYGQSRQRCVTLT
ncbi:serine/threonine protein kinase [Nocardioides cavernae]|uniref:non-specific serine/threonine protein kinase n=1 Tax=Nocardioides cavernae TaxID=1921566 RepID=A0A7Y9GZE0_9ACTN|nr:serine/threonine-protein kinase [Nocardioides cavernae]NYE35137.1 serine/threonine protein kinase [Nocardioides cavernae]